MTALPKLLCTLGISWPIVPEAFFHSEGAWSEVHVITTSGALVKTAPVIEFLRERMPGRFSVSQIRDVGDLRNAVDHQRFEEALFRWYLQHLDPQGPLPVVCLSGGYKSISAAMQKAASLFGAKEIFHVLADKVRQPTGPDREPGDLVQVLDAQSSGGLHYISLGIEPGWSLLKEFAPADFPLELEFSPADATVADFVSVLGDGRQLSEFITKQLQQVANRAAAWTTRGALPFDSLALLPVRELRWLQRALDPGADEAWVRALPKLELHCHLGGFATHGVELERVRAKALGPSTVWLPAPPPPSNWPDPAAPVALDTYMHLGDATGSALLKDPGCLREQCAQLYAALQADRVLYAEIRCSPNNYASDERSAWTVLDDIRETFQRCMTETHERSEFTSHVNLIVIATRKKNGDLSDISRHLALAITANQHHSEPTRCRVVGVDLAGFEEIETRAAYFTEDFRAIHRCGVAVTAHAGENDGAEGIWQAVYHLHARRLGHALHLKAAPDLLRTIVERRIGIEMCPYANFQIKGFSPMPHAEQYPLRDYLQAGVTVTVNTDNMGISAANLSDNLLLLARLNPGITRMELLQLQRNAIETAFAGHALRSELLLRFNRELPRCFSRT